MRSAAAPQRKLGVEVTDVGSALRFATAGADVLVISWPYATGPRDVPVTLGPA